VEEDEGFSGALTQHGRPLYRVRAARRSLRRPGHLLKAPRSLCALLSVVAGCHSGALVNARNDDGAGTEDGSVPGAPVPSDARGTRPQVQLTWQLFETMRSLDSSGQEQESAVFQLLVNGGTPARVALGRRASLACAVRGATGGDAPALVTGLDCHTHADGEHARVERASPGELRVEAFGQDEAHPDHEPPRTGVKSATIRIPADAEIVVEPTLMTVPDEAPSKR
jgi:hypothetical protein